MQQMTQEAMLATPPKPSSQKPGAKSAAVAKKAPVVKMVPKPVQPVAEPKLAPATMKAKPIATSKVVMPKAAQPVTRAELPPVSAPAPVAEPVVKPVTAESTPAAAEPPQVEWPVAAMPAEPEQLSEPATLKSTPVLADAPDILPVATAGKTKGETIMTDVLETAKSYAEEAKNRFQSAFVEVNEKTKAAVEKSSKAFEELGELTKGNLEAVVESSKIAAKGVETLGQDAAEFSRKSFEKTSATMKSFAAVKTPAEFFQLQSDLLSATFDSFASEASKNSEAFLKLASDISTPISNRVSVVTEKMKSLAA